MHICTHAHTVPDKMTLIKTFINSNKLLVSNIEVPCYEWSRIKHEAYLVLPLVYFILFLKVIIQTYLMSYIEILTKQFLIFFVPSRNRLPRVY